MVPLVVLAIICGVFLFSYGPEDNTVVPQIEENREQTDRVTQVVTEASEPHKDSKEVTPVEIPEQVQREVNEIIEPPQILDAPVPLEEDEEDPTEEPADPVAAAWVRLEYISQNPQEWGEFSPEAAELMDQLTPTWRTKTRGETEEVIVLLEELGKLHDPRSAELFVYYLSGNRLWIRYVEAALIAIGPPSVPPLVPILDQNGSFSNSFKRKRAAKLLGIIGSKYQQELSGAVEYVLLPKLEELAMLDPDYYGVRVVAIEAISLLSSEERDSTVTSQIEGKRQQADRVTATKVETSEQSQIPQALEPVEENRESLPAPEEPADPVTAAWVRLEYISQNPQEWGKFSLEAAELMAQLTPTWIIRSEGEGEKAIELLNQLTKFHDPRSAEIFVNYMRTGTWGRSMEAALITIGPPSVLPLILLLTDNEGFLNRRRAAKLLGIIGFEYQEELGGVVEYILLPKLKELAISDPNPRVREVAGEAISRFSYLLQDNTVETPEAVDREINEIIEPPQVLHTPGPSAENGKSLPTPEASADLAAAAWVRLEYISQNLQEWGEFSPEATELIAQLTPTRPISTEEEMDEVIVLFEKLGKLRDPRSAEVIINYFLGVGLWEKPMKEALIAIGPPSVPLLIPLLEADTRLLGRLIGTKLLGIIGAEHRQELGDAVEYIILPKLEKLVTFDPSPRVRWYASVAISRIRYRQQDNTVEPPEQIKHEINEVVEQLQVPHASEPAAKDEEDSTGQPADPVAAAWARLEYISQNPQKWGEFSPKAADLMAQLTPTWVFDEADGEGPAEDAFKLLVKLASFQDPRSAEVIANYIGEGFGLSNEEVIPIGPPLVPALIPLLDANTRFAGRLMSVDILGILGEKHRHELGGAVEHIILPKLEQLAISDPSPIIQQHAREAISKLR